MPHPAFKTIKAGESAASLFKLFPYWVDLIGIKPLIVINPCFLPPSTHCHIIDQSLQNNSREEFEEPFPSFLPPLCVTRFAFIYIEAIAASSPALRDYLPDVVLNNLLLLILGKAPKSILVKQTVSWEVNVLSFGWSDILDIFCFFWPFRSW